MASTPPVVMVVVSPAGNDRAEGTLAAPLATLSAAVSRVRASRKGGPGAIIHLLPGTYRLPATQELGVEDSGTTEAPLIIEGDPKGEVRLTGTRVVAGLAPLAPSACPPRLPPAARGRIWAASLPAAAWPDLPGLVATGFGRSLVPHGVELMFKRKIMSLAGWPDGGYSQALPATESGPAPAFRMAEQGRFAGWQQEPDLWVYGFWNQDWRDSYEHVQKLDTDTALIHLDQPGPIGKILPGQRVRVLNALSELDQPGEWYLDRTTRMLYFWPPATPGPEDTELMLLPVLIRGKGIRNLILRGLTFDGTRTTALSLQGVEGVTVQSCRFENLGSGAVDLVGKNSRIEGCEVRDAGEGGLYLTGGDRQTLTPGNLVAHANHITRVNRWGRCYRPAIQLNGVGNVAELNFLEDLSQAAILFYGNDHQISCNRIERVCKEAGDAGAIYSGQDWSARGNVVEGNQVSDVGGSLPKPVAGIYLDDQLCGTVVRNNLIQRVPIGILVGGGRDNLVQGNWFNRCQTSVFMDGRGLTWQKPWLADPNSPISRNLKGVPYQGKAYGKYPGLARVLEDRPGAPLGNRLEGNRAVGALRLEILPEAKVWVVEADNQGEVALPSGFPFGCGSSLPTGGK
jgi:hypothetical protein